MDVPAAMQQVVGGEGERVVVHQHIVVFADGTTFVLQCVMLSNNCGL